MSKRTKFAMMSSMLATMLLTAATYACPMCKDTISHSDPGQSGSLPGGFNHSIYFMLFSAITVGALVCGMIFKAVKETGIRPVGFQVLEKK